MYKMCSSLYNGIIWRDNYKTSHPEFVRRLNLKSIMQSCNLLRRMIYFRALITRAHNLEKTMEKTLFLQKIDVSKLPT